MTTDRLSVLHLSHMPSSPPRFGAQARMHGLLTEVAKRHDVTAVTLLDEEFDEAEVRREMGAYCREVVVLPNPNGRQGLSKRLLQVRSMLSLHSYEHHRYAVPGLQATLDRLMTSRRFDVVNLEFPYLAHYRMRTAPPGAPPPPVVVDAHDIAYDIPRQMARTPGPAGRRLYAAVNWRKLRRDELAAVSGADAVAVCSELDRQRLHADVPGADAWVIPNAANVEHYQPRPGDPRPDGRTLLFFGLLSTVPNVDALQWFVREVWPHVVRARPDARLKIVGAWPPPAVQALAGNGVELTGFVDDLRPHLAEAAAIVVPIRLGSGTRLKIVEAMAMGKAIVSTRLGAEGLAGEHGKQLLIADEPGRFAAEALRLLDDPALAARLGAAGRTLAVEKYAWSAAARRLEELYREVIARRDAGAGKKG